MGTTALILLRRSPHQATRAPLTRAPIRRMSQARRPRARHTTQARLQIRGQAQPRRIHGQAQQRRIHIQAHPRRLLKQALMGGGDSSSESVGRVAML